MNKRIALFVLVALMLLTTVLVGCSGRTSMLMGRWRLTTYGDETGQNQQQYPLPMVLDVYPNGTIDLLDSPFGTYTMERDSFTFASDDGEITASGQFQLEYPKLTIYMDDEPFSYVLEKIYDLDKLESVKASAQAGATATPAATATAK